ncbi:MAG TPA: porin family protein [Pyrinomonadaceae bacterium]|nr:porin family protein [Pyrinomonadaceae bacterium]
MRKAIFAAIIFSVVGPAAFAQEEYKRGTFGVQYNHNRVDTGGAFDPNGTSDDREGFNGVSVNAGYNFHRFVGAEFDFSHVRKETTVGLITAPPSNTTVDLKGRLTQFLGGVRLQDNRTETSVRPFARALVGVAHASAEGSTTGFTIDESETGFGAEIGGGLDVRLNNNVDLTAISVGYNPTRLDDTTQHNFKIGVGLRFRF